MVGEDYAAREHFGGSHRGNLQSFVMQPPTSPPGCDRVTRHAVVQEKLAKESLIRRSTRDPSIHMLDRKDLSTLLHKIVKNDPSTVVLKIKDHIQADINSVVFDAIVEALGKNRVCQCLYIQNLAKAIGDEQVRHLIELLKKKIIWGVNIGESYEVSQAGWRYFCSELKNTNVTHLYVSEHTIPIELKNEMRDNIRENRKKHDLHCRFKNLHVIERCTNMWWNPINGVKELKPPPPPTPVEPEEEEAPAVPVELTPAHTAYWQEGVGKGGEKPWKFKCTCGETCSSYENYRYHPTGRMYECSNPACCLWSHVACVLGPQVTDAELAKRKDLLCGACKAKSRRLIKSVGVDIIALNAQEAGTSDDKGTSKKAGGNRTTTTGAPNGNGHGAANGDGEEEDGTPWKFKCKCGEVCSSYEKSIYHPAGQWYECSQCSVWSHVHCNLGNATPAQVAAMPEVLCFSCTTAARRSRKRGAPSTETSAASSLEQPPAKLPAVVSDLSVQALTITLQCTTATSTATTSVNSAPIEAVGGCVTVTPVSTSTTSPSDNDAAVLPADQDPDLDAVMTSALQPVASLVCTAALKQDTLSVVLNQDTLSVAALVDGTNARVCTLEGERQVLEEQHTEMDQATTL